MGTRVKNVMKCVWKMTNNGHLTTNPKSERNLYWRLTNIRDQRPQFDPGPLLTKIYSKLFHISLITLIYWEKP